MTGDVGFNTDAEEIFGSLDAKLLIATVLLVLFLLGAIYRSLLVALTPLVVVGLSYGVAQGLIYFYAKSGATVSTNSTDHPGRADVRRGHRLLPPARLALPGGAAALRGQARRDDARPVSHRPGDPGQRADGRALDAGAAARPRTADPVTRARRGDRCHLLVHRRPHAAAGTAHDRWPAGVLAPAQRGRMGPRACRSPEHRHLAPDRRPRAAAARACARGHSAALRHRRARPARLQGGLQHHRRSSRRRPRAWRASGCWSGCCPREPFRRSRSWSSARRPGAPGGRRAGAPPGRVATGRGVGDAAAEPFARRPHRALRRDHQRRPVQVRSARHRAQGSETVSTPWAREPGPLSAAAPRSSTTTTARRPAT